MTGVGQRKVGDVAEGSSISDSEDHLFYNISSQAKTE